MALVLAESCLLERYVQPHLVVDFAAAVAAAAAAEQRPVLLADKTGVVLLADKTVLDLLAESVWRLSSISIIIPRSITAFLLYPEGYIGADLRVYSWPKRTRREYNS